MNMLQMSEAMRDGRSISLKSQTQLIIALSIPAILEQLVMTLMSYIDTAMVGSLGPGATAAIGVVASSIWLMNGLTSAIAVGFSVQIAQYLGAGQVLPELLGSDPEIAPAARSYFCTVAFFFPFSMASALYSSILRCSGNILLPSIMNVGMCAFDVIFNFIFIYPPREIGGFHIWGAGLGVQGAALGTGLAQACVAVTLLLGIICRKGPLRFQGNETWRFTKPCMNNMLRLSTPTALERMALSLAQIVMTSVVAGMGTVAVASNYVAVQTESICYLPAFGVASAATALVGQSIGARRLDMAKRFAYGTTILGSILVFFMALLMFGFAPFLTSLLTADTEVAEVSAGLLRIVAFSEPLFAVSIVATGALRGAGDSKAPFFINLFTMWGVRVMTVLVFTHRFGVTGVWISMTAELITRGIVFLIRLLRGRWLKMPVLF